MTQPVGVAPEPSVAQIVAVMLHAAARRLGEAGIVTARQDAEVLLGRALGTTRLGLYTRGRAPVTGEALATFEGLMTRRLRHEPVQYLLGETEFCGLVLGIGPGVFIPRPETEELVHRALALGPRAVATVLDLCAGSGAIACALAAQRLDWTVWAVEQATPAAVCARANVQRLGLAERVRVLDGDLFAPLAGRVPPGTVDLVVANPPYLAASLLRALPAEVRQWEPRAAIDGGVDGLVVIRRLLAEAADWLRPGGATLVEIGHEHGPAAAGLAGADLRYADVTIRRDFLGRERVLEARRR